MQLIAGIDEAGRGPLAGPVMAAAVILDPKNPIEGLADSKLLTELQRKKLAILIRERALAFAVAYANVEEIDAINILRASLLAMQRAVEALKIKPDYALVDGIHCPKIFCPVTAIIRGDQTEAAISAASILAKVARDEEMIRLDQIYSGYGFAKHKGYPTKDHVSALKKLGVSEIHRRTFRPVRELLEINYSTI